MAPRKGASPFSRVKSPQLDPNKYWYVLSNKVFGERPPKYFCRKFSARFPEDLKIKRGDLQNEDGGPHEGKASSEDKIVASSCGVMAAFLRHAADSPLFKEEAFTTLKTFLNGLDLSILCEDGVDTGTHVAVSLTPVLKARANRRLVLPSPASSSGTVMLSQQEVDEDTGCFLPVTPPHSCPKISKKVRI